MQTFFDVTDSSGKTLRLDADVTGEGSRTFLVLPGLSGHYQNYRQVIDGLAQQGNRVIALNLPGHGASEGRLRLDELPSNLAQVIEQIEGECVIAAHSGSSDAALQVAYERPDKIEKVALLNPLLDASFLPLFSSLFPYFSRAGVGVLYGAGKVGGDGLLGAMTWMGHRIGDTMRSVGLGRERFITNSYTIAQDRAQLWNVHVPSREYEMPVSFILTGGDEQFGTYHHPKRWQSLRERALDIVNGAVDKSELYVDANHAFSVGHGKFSKFGDHPLLPQLIADIVR